MTTTSLINLEEFTKDQPFCGGVCVWNRARLVFTVAKPKRWQLTASDHWDIPVAWVGGGQELGETVRECALREAMEEISCPVSLVSAERTYWFENDREVCGLPLEDPIRPAIVDLYPGLGRPYKPGLPVGPTVYVAIYKATLLGTMMPNDVPALIEVPFEYCNLLQHGISVSQAKYLGIPIHVHEHTALPLNGILRLQRGGPEVRIISLWQQNLLTSD